MPHPVSAGRSSADLLAGASTTKLLALPGVESGNSATKSSSSDFRTVNDSLDPESVSTSRRIWVVLTWALTFWIPSYLLQRVGGMSRPDVRLAWREKVTICLLITVLNAAMIFIMVFVGNHALLAFAIAFSLIRTVKTVAAFLGGLSDSSRSSRRRQFQTELSPFVICFVPIYTEGEDKLRRSLDSLAQLKYDNKRKLICVVCDGLATGEGNDEPTPNIVLDILGVSRDIDPPALPFRSVGQGSEQLNCGKVYSGLYEHRGNVVPYIVVVKVGNESEKKRHKPGHRGKRDSQVLLLSFLSRVHHNSPMSPLELELFHQLRNVIGVSPGFYEYLFMIDADTTVEEQSLNNLVACCLDDVNVAGICGETLLENEGTSLPTIIQVYEYYSSFHLTKVFESVFGSVTCLPGCFCMYRLRSSESRRALIISNGVIDDYSDGDVDTLHKKNLLSLGEDRYLTTLMMKHFPRMKYQFTSGAKAYTTASYSWDTFFSQRRRWINSTIHNLVELMFSGTSLCGFLCLNMKVVVWADLFSTLILPATATSLVYLIYKVAVHSGRPALISLIMVGATYAVQALVFIFKFQFGHVFWMLSYLLAFPIYCLILPVHSFWNQDNFSWGRTRVALGEKQGRKIVTLDDRGFDPHSIQLQRWADYEDSLWERVPSANDLPGRHAAGVGSRSGFEMSYDTQSISSYGSNNSTSQSHSFGFQPRHNHAPANNIPEFHRLGAASRAAEESRKGAYELDNFSVSERITPRPPRMNAELENQEIVGEMDYV